VSERTGHHSLTLAATAQPNRSKLRGIWLIAHELPRMSRKRSRRTRKPTPAEELYHFLDQSRISLKNVERVSGFLQHSDPGVRELAAVVLGIAQVAPRRRKRILTLAREHPDLFIDMVAVLGDGFWDEYFVRHRDESEWLRERWDAAHWQVRFHAHGKTPCWCGSGTEYWLCCGDRDDVFAAQFAAEERERAWILNPETIPWWHPDSGVDPLTRSAYEMFVADPDHPLAIPPPGWQNDRVQRRPAKRKKRKRNQRAVGK
jgi:hypothetical protein